MITDFQSKKLIYFFNLMDITGDGKLSVEDSDTLSAEVKAEAMEEMDDAKKMALLLRARKFFEQLRKEMGITNRYIHRTDWMKFMNQLISDQDQDGIDEVVRMVVGFVFVLFDENSDGYISGGEYSQIFESLGVPVEDAVASFNKLDANEDGRLSRYEILSAVEVFFTSDNQEEPGNWVFGNWNGEQAA